MAMTAQQLRDLRTKLATDSARMRAEIEERQQATLRGELPMDIVRKTYIPEEPQEPAPRPRFGTMAPELVARWDQWAESLIRKALADNTTRERAHLDAALQAVGGVIGEHVRLMDDKVAALRTEIGTLRAQITLLEAVAKGRVTALPTKSKSNAA